MQLQHYFRLKTCSEIAVCCAAKYHSAVIPPRIPTFSNLGSVVAPESLTLMY